MAKTVTTNATSYLSVAEFLKRVDWRVVADLASDDGTRLAEAALTTNVNVLAVLLDASGDVESAAMMGGKYSAEDLAALTGVAQAKLYRIISDLAICYLYERRPSQDAKTPASMDRTQAWLEKLVEGTRIFGFQETVDASVLDHDTETVDHVETRNLPTYIARRMFGTRANRWPAG